MGGSSSGGGRELTLLREEVDELRMELGEARRRLDSEKMETENVSSDHKTPIFYKLCIIIQL